MRSASACLEGGPLPAWCHDRIWAWVSGLPELESRYVVAGCRTGGGIGCSHLEQPEFKEGDRTVLKEAMTFAVDGGITIPGAFGAGWGIRSW